MTKRVWEFEINGIKHNVQLQHGVFSGKREIWVDGRQVLKARILIDGGSQYPFLVENVPCELGITTNGITFDYYFLVDGKKISAIGVKDKPPSKATRRSLEEFEYWQKLADLSGLKYLPTQTANSAFRHRLIGHTRGHLTIIRSGLFPNSAIPFAQVLLRVTPIADADGMRAVLKQEVHELRKQNKGLLTDTLEVQKDHVALSVIYQPHKVTPELTFTRIGQILEMFFRHVSSLYIDRCEGIECKSRLSQDTQLVFVNGFPTYLCKDCIERIPSQAQKAQQEYRKAPSGLLKGLTAGLAAAIAGGLIWAIVAVYLNTIGAGIAAIILILVVKVMDKVGTKRTVWSILLAGLLSTIGIVVGVYFTYALYGYTHYPEYPLSEVLERAWQSLLKFGEYFRQSLFFGLLGIVVYLWLLGSGTKKQITQIAKPVIEIIEGWKPPQ